MSEKQSNLTDKEMEDLQVIVTDTLASVCAMADKHNIDRDSMLKYFADMLTAFTEVASIQNYETSLTCNCQHNSNLRDNEPCCRCDSKVSENDDTKKQSYISENYRKDDRQQAILRNQVQKSRRILLPYRLLRFIQY